jgi:electron-transferring-flavoprotein dehydrogenase
MDREVMPVDVVLVGAGPANLACAIRLKTLLAAAGRAGDFEVMVLEKGREVGDHILSGAVMDPRGMVELMGADWREKGCPVDADVASEAVFILGERRARRLPWIPPVLGNHGAVIVSLSEVVRWMREQAEALGVTVAEGMPAAELVLDGGHVMGVRLVDRGRNPDGSEGPGFEPGAEIQARVTVLGEGSRGSLTKALVDGLGLSGPNPQVYGTGVKELWEIPSGRIAQGTVWHSAGWPLPDSTYGGSWIYALSDTRVSIGFVTALDGGDPACDPYETMQRWKTHPMVAALLAGGTLLKSGSKTVPEGGWWSRPKSHGPGFLILGDGASLLNAARLKGIHLAIKSGILAAETIAEALIRGDCGEAALAAYERRLEGSWIRSELRRVRNWRQAFSRHGFRRGKYVAGLAWALGGRILRDRLPIHSDAEAMRKGRIAGPSSFRPDGTLTVDKLTGVFLAGSVHQESQPSHLVVADTRVCVERCTTEYGNPCQRFCPAAVYEMVEVAGEERRLQIHFSNCVHCKTCDVADPYGLITWAVPQDGGGPRYRGL